MSGQCSQRILVATDPDDAGLLEESTSVDGLVSLQHVSEVDFRAAHNRSNHVMLRFCDPEALKCELEL